MRAKKILLSGVAAIATLGLAVSPLMAQAQGLTPPDTAPGPLSMPPRPVL
ncbi:hypothetical protein [Arcanobacterium hippocoleae]